VFFEAGVDCPDTSSPWAGVRAALGAGSTHDARVEARALTPRLPGDLTLAVEACVAHGDAAGAVRWLARHARTFADSWHVAVGDVRALALRGRLLAARRRLASDAPWTASALSRAMRDALHARVLAQMQREATALLALEELDARPEAKHPLAAYERAQAWMALRRWDRARALFRDVRAACPEWVRPAMHEASCLAFLGDPAGELALLTELKRRFPRHDELKLAFVYELARRDRWEDVLAEIPADGEDEDRSFRWLRMRGLWRTGRRDEALSVARALGPEHAERLANAGGGGRTRLAVPALVQERSMCVPASVAMVMRFHGHRADPAELYRRMSGVQGVASWQLDRWARDHGWSLADVRVEPDAFRAVIERGHPLLVTRSSLLMSHMEVAVGVDDGLAEVETLDPAYGTPRIIPFERLARAVREAEILLPPGAAPDLDPAIDGDAAACRRIRRELYVGDPEEAVRQNDRLPDGRAARRMRLEVREALLEPAAIARTAEAVARDGELDPEERLRGAQLLAVFGQEAAADAIVAEMAPDLSEFLRRWWRMSRARRARAWPAVLRRTTALVERAAHVEDFWYQHAHALRAHGRIAEAQAAMDVGLEIAPLDLPLLLGRVRMNWATRDLDAELAILSEAQAIHPLCEEIVERRARMESEAGRPAECERLLRDAVRRMPRSRRARAALDAWFLDQERGDLVREPEPEAQAAGEPGPDTRVRMALNEVLAGRDDQLVKLVELEAAGVLTDGQRVDVRQLCVLKLLLAPPGRFAAAALEAELPKTLAAPVSESVAYFLDWPISTALHPAAARALAAWVDRLMAGCEWGPSGRFARAHLDEVGGERVKAEAVYEELARVERAPGAYLRLGSMAVEQQRLADADRWLRELLAARPGSVPGWRRRLAFAELIEDAELAAEARARLIELGPYDHDAAGEWLGALLEAGRAGEMHAWLREHGARYRQGFVRHWSVYALAEEKRAEEALALLGPEALAEEPVPSRMLRLMVLQELERDDEIAACAVEGLGVAPEHPTFARLAAASIEKTDPDQARKLYATSFCASPHPATALAVLRLARGAGAAVHALLEDPRLEPDARGAALSAAHAALEELAGAQAARKLAQWARQRFPDDQRPLEMLIDASLAGDRGELIPLVEALMAQDPHDAGRLATAARALAAVEPARALRLWARHFEKTGNAESLIECGFCYVDMDQNDHAVELYERALRTNPCMPTAISNLVLKGVSRASMFDAAVQCLALCNPERVQMFCCAAVSIAVAARRPLPVSWEARARARLEFIARNGDAVDDEVAQLLAMLAIWWKRRGEPDRTRELGRTYQDGAQRTWLTWTEAWGWITSWVPVP
jgi:tetratricopeptide (TPR) repeat protein